MGITFFMRRERVGAGRIGSPSLQKQKDPRKKSQVFCGAGQN